MTRKTNNTQFYTHYCFFSSIGILTSLILSLHQNCTIIDTRLLATTESRRTPFFVQIFAANAGVYQSEMLIHTTKH